MTVIYHHGSKKILDSRLFFKEHHFICVHRSEHHETLSFDGDIREPSLSFSRIYLFFGEKRLSIVESNRTLTGGLSGAPFEIHKKPTPDSSRRCETKDLSSCNTGGLIDNTCGKSVEKKLLRTFDTHTLSWPSGNLKYLLAFVLRDILD